MLNRIRWLVMGGLIALMSVLPWLGISPATAQDDPDALPPGRIIYLKQIDGVWQLTSINTDGSDERAIFRPEFDPTGVLLAPVWSPDGRRIMISVNHTVARKGEDMPQQRTYFLDASGKEAINTGDLGNSERLYRLNHYTYGGWTADSQWFIYGLYNAPEGKPAYTEFYKMDMEGNSIALDIGAEATYQNVISRSDGSLLILDVDGHLMIADEDGNDKQIVRTDAAVSFLYAVSPDGSKALALVSRNHTFAIVDLLTGRILLLPTISNSMIAYGALWSPDGTRFLVQGAPRADTGDSLTTPEADPPEWATYIVSAEGETVILLEDGPAYYWGRVSWSPDSAYLLYSVCEGPDCVYRIVAHPVEGGDPVVITDGVQPDWQPLTRP